MVAVFYGLFLAYAVWVIAMSIGIIRLQRLQRGCTSQDHSSITVLVAVRNEAHHILPLIGALKVQDCAAQVIFIDDHSTDNTVQVIAEAIVDMSNTSLISLGEGSGKKMAIELGVRAASGDIIVTTDADCRMGPDWLKVIKAPFADSRVQMVLGPVSIGASSPWSGLQALEFASVMGVTAGFVSFHKPVMCNGANLAYRKSAFLAVAGYTDNTGIISGDDEFLLRKVMRHFADAVRMTLQPEARVTTDAVSPGAFIHQRVRWGSKWRRHNDKTSALVAVFIFAFHLSNLILPLFWLAGALPSIVAGTLTGIKILPEILFMITASKAFGVKWDTRSFVMLEVLYSPYVVVIGLLSNFGKFRWKERKYSVHATRAESVT